MDKKFPSNSYNELWILQLLELSTYYEINIKDLVPLGQRYQVDSIVKGETN